MTDSKTYRGFDFDDEIMVTYKTMDKDVDNLTKSVLELLDRIYVKENYRDRPIFDFNATYLLHVNNNTQIKWLVRNWFLEEALENANNEQIFYSIVTSHLGFFNREQFEKLLSISNEKNQIYLLCLLHEKRHQFKKQLYNKAEYLKKFEDMCDDEEKVFDMDVLKKRTVSGSILRSDLIPVFIDKCTTEKMFDKWIGKSTSFGGKGYKKFHINDESKISLLKKWVELNCNLNISISAKMKTEKNLIDMLDILNSCTSKRNSGLSYCVERVLNIIGKMTSLGEFNQDIFEEKIFKTSLTRKAVTNKIVKQYSDYCPNYMAFKKL